MPTCYQNRSGVRYKVLYWFNESVSLNNSAYSNIIYAGKINCLLQLKNNYNHLNKSFCRFLFKVSNNLLFTKSCITTLGCLLTWFTCHSSCILIKCTFFFITIFNVGIFPHALSVVIDYFCLCAHKVWFSHVVMHFFAVRIKHGDVLSTFITLTGLINYILIRAVKLFLVEEEWLKFWHCNPWKMAVFGFKVVND